MTVTQRGSSWVAKVWSPIEKKEVYLGGKYPTKDDAMRAVLDAKDEFKNPKKSNEVTFKRVADEWLASKKHSKRYTTVRDYETNYNHLVHAFGKDDKGKDKFLHEITADDYSDAVTRFQYWGYDPESMEYESYLIEPKNPVSRKQYTVRKFTMRFRQILNFAKQRRYHMPDVDRGTAFYLQKVDSLSKRAEVIPDKTIPLVLAALDGQFRVVFLIALGSGLRRNEILALKPSSFHHSGGEEASRHYWLNVRNALGYEVGANGKKVRVSTALKSPNGRRQIPISRELRDEVFKFIRESRENTVRDDDYIFTQFDGQPWHDTYFSRHFRKQLNAGGEDTREELALKQVSLHQARHHFASMCIDAGVSIVELSVILGHYSPSMTLSVYAHLFKQTNREAFEGVGSKVFKDYVK